MILKRILLALLSLSLIGNQAALALTGTTTETDSSQADQLAFIGHVMSSANELRKHIDRGAFDLEALLDSLNYDSEEIRAFVRHEIAFEQYPGVLRGAQGALMARAGNSVDQSIMLAKLMKDAGFDARIVQGKLSDQDASRLLEELGRPRLARPSIGDLDGIVPELKKLGVIDLSGIDSAVDNTESSARKENQVSASEIDEVMQTASLLTENFERAGVRISSGSLVDYLEEATEYFWVQYRESAADLWVDAHPSFGDQVSPEVEIQEYYADTIPEEYQHRLTFQVFVEKQVNGRLESIALTEPWTRPTANLNGVPLVFSNIPDSLLSSPRLTVDLRRKIKDANWFAPVFGSSPAGAKYFDLNGTLIDSMAAASAPAGLFSTIGGLFGDALEKIGEDDAPFLTAQWLEFTFTSPDGSQRQHRRYTLDRIGAGARKTGRIPEDLTPTTSEHVFGLTQKYTFMVTTGETPRGMASDFSLDSLVKARPFFEGLMDELSDARSGKSSDLDTGSIPNYWTGHLTLFTELDRANNLGTLPGTYRSGPALVIYREGLRSSSSVIQAIDIVQNPRRSIFFGSDEGGANDQNSVMLAGIWETLIEGVLIAPSDKLFNTMAGFAKAAERNIELEVYAPGTIIESDSFHPDTVANLQNDLDNGFAVLVPHQQSEIGPVWWRVNPTTGETLGQVGDGRGAGEAVKYLAVLTFGFSVAMLAVSLVGCVGDYRQSVMDDDPVIHEYNAIERGELLCCTLWSILAFAIGLMAGGVGAPASAQAVHNATQASVSWDLISWILPNPICSAYDSGDP